MTILLPLVTAVLAIGGEYQPKRTLVYIFKPLTTLLIIWMALTGPTAAPLLYKWLIIIGLVFCLGGDIFLMLPAKYFIAGLVSFLIGHLVYIVAFVSDSGFHPAPIWLILLAAYGFIFYRILAPGLAKMRVPVIAYILTILTMAWQAWGRWSALPAAGTLLAAVGAALFVASDSFLAYDRFRQKFAMARVVVLSTYWAAQWLIAYSVIYS
ncbi:MAG: lysoplasmalogenase [Ardenticatenaceae bacterium]|nr:lysoplasmalogenase [Ardenticatenaceae bacterium]MCB9443805.1 lysoplasmalogenase [Ardenticatenaceae bacterium]